MELPTVITIVFTFIVFWWLSLYWDFYFFIWLSVISSVLSFHPSGTILSISYRADLVATNSLSFCVSRNILISPSFFKDSLPDIGCLVDGWSFVFVLFYSVFSIFVYILAHCLLSSIDFVEKSAKYFIQDLLCWMSHFSLITFKIISLLFNYNLSWCGCPWFHLSWNSLRFLQVYFNVYIKFGKFSTIISLKILSFFFFWDPRDIYADLLNCVSKVS